MNPPDVKIVAENHTRFRTNLLRQIILCRGNYVVMDKDLARSLKGPATSLLTYLQLLQPDEHPSVKELADFLQCGLATVGKLLERLKSLGLVDWTPIAVNGARGRRIDLLGENYNWPEIQSSRRDESLSKSNDPTPGRYPRETTQDPVVILEKRPEHSNPCPSMVTTPLIEYMENLNTNNGMEEPMNVISDIGRIGSPGKGLRIVRPEPANQVDAELVEICKQVENALRFRDRFIKYDVTHQVISSLRKIHGSETLADWITWLKHPATPLPRTLGKLSWGDRLRHAWNLYENRDQAPEELASAPAPSSWSEEDERRFRDDIACEPAMPY